MAEAGANSSLVVIGSSAGGVEALSTLLPMLPSDFPAPIVIAQHVDPPHPSHLTQILARHATLQVRTVAEHEALEPGVVFVVPSNRNVEITDRDVTLRSDSDGGPKPSVDLLFTSAAQAYGENLIAVILTGTGSDGAAGARHVKEAGGTVIIQNPETATYPAMALSLAPTTVDIVADLERIGPLLHELVTGSYIPARPDEDRTLQSFLSQLRDHSGIDFNAYKQPTILRRLQRRMAATGTPKLGDYIRFTQSHPEEYQRLVTSFLIKVTGFYRDRALFKYLEERMLPRLIADARARNAELRIWSAGCATGEEAYSLAILVSDLLGDELPDFNVRIFATDLDGDALAFARRGIYPAPALANLPDTVAARHFTQSDGEYEVGPRVRRLIVFGQHDLGQRAPFPRMDLVMCRNVLIYFTSELQQRALQLFAYSLRQDGYLVLGQAESTSALGDYFAPDHSRLKVFVRVGGRILLPPARARNVTLALPVRMSPVRGVRTLEGARGEPEAQRPQTVISAERLIGGLPVGVVIVDRHYDIRSINNAARRLLGIHGSAVGEDLIHLAPRGPAASIKGAIDAALHKARAEPTELQAEVETAARERRHIRIVCSGQRVEGATGPPDTALLVISDVTADVEERGRLERSHADDQTRAAQPEEALNRLEATNRQLLGANEEMTDAVNQLRATNEEFLLGNEETQAASEEVETLNEELQASEELGTLNEELQASNEELETLNEELQATAQELNATNDHLQARSVELQATATSLEEQRAASEAEQARLEAVLTSMEDAVLVVDGAGNRVRANRAYDAVFGEGQQVVVRDLDGNALVDEATSPRRAARGESFSMEFTIDGHDGLRHWYEAIGRPIRTHGEEGGGVLVIRDITDRSLRALQEEFLAMASHDLRTPLTALQVYLEMVLQLLGRGEGGERAQHYGNLALIQTRRLGQLVGDLVDVGRLQYGKLALHLTDVDVAAVVGEAVEIAQQLAHGQTIHVEEQAAVRVQADRGRLVQVLLNLLTNAITYAPGTERIDVRLRAVDGQAEIEVQDYGHGVPATELPQIFGRFYQARVPATVADRGLGLGLYIARELVTAHGGTIDVQSIEGQGTTFTVRLPLTSRES